MAVAIVITWSEPEDGVAVYGPYVGAAEAEEALPFVESDFHNDGELPEDVVIETMPMCRETR